ncbi:MAG: SH3 domain-containing protein [Devosia sp.]
MRALVRLATAAVFATVATATLAADLPRAPAVVVERATNFCVINARGGAVEMFVRPFGASSGYLPNGMIVEVIDYPFDRRSDLWIRIRPPRVNQYYGWVATRDFFCH